MSGREQQETLSRDESIAPTTHVDGPHLFRVFECDAPMHGPSRHRLAGLESVHIGRGGRETRRNGAAPRSLELRIPDAWMSSSHAVLRHAYGRWVVEDAGSKNGIWIEGKIVGQQVLKDGDVLEIGHTLFVYREARRHVADDPDRYSSVPPPSRAVPLQDTTLLPELEDRYERLARIAGSQIAVLLRGETGTGKELVARAVHAASGRAGPFLAVNCGAIHGALLEAELFGSKRGSFSGSTEDRIGLVRAAERGTLLLDEVGELSPSTQVALLRVLQERQVLPVGGTRPIDVDVRICAATHRDLERMVEAGTFRRDLLARLDGFSLTLSPLRDRKEDIGLIVATLLARRVTASPPPSFRVDAARALFAHDWPFNVRELEHVIESACVLSAPSPVALEHLPSALRARAAPTGERPRATSAPPPPDVDDAACDEAKREITPEDDERRAAMTALLTQERGNISAVARKMGKDRVQIRRWLRRFRIDPDRYK